MTVASAHLSTIVIRRIEDQDRAEVARFMEGLCCGSRRYRFLGQMADSAGLLTRGLTQFDFEPDSSFGAVSSDDARGEFMGIARYSLNVDGCKCECTVIQSERWPDPGLGLALMRRLMELARERGIQSLYSVDDVAESGMHSMAEAMGFQSRPDPLDPELCIRRLELRPVESMAA